MSNHFSADKLKFPGDDRRLDLTDVFVFQSSENPDRTVLIIDSNPTSAPPPIPAPTTGPEFHPDAVYRINIDNNGDHLADIAFTFTFSPFENGMQTGTVWYATGEPGPASPSRPAKCSPTPFRSASTAPPGRSGPAPSGSAPACAATRSSPTWKAPCTDSTGPVTTTSPTTTSTPSPWRYPATCWAAARSSECGPPSACAATASWCRWTGAGTPPSTRSSTPTARKTSTTPASPPTTWPTTSGRGPKSWKAAATHPEEARTAAMQVLPDILPYDRTQPAAYPNGRVLTDDVYSLRFAWLTNGKVPPSGLKPHDDLQAQFPYLGVPNPPPEVK